ncbi:hypothetical protein BT96DRAFT_1024906 [Gymnopus androsaceus JB14]|uniref:Uncharacterized protein n=1 Tax=Gymnopus androsaceus JB14 TaxID=1447944 RepID=A0A6A4GVB5_9AGAR|nr:hypothetical protein BT96DRAFT_1024906 [Gymnopus androsaceus JB14]
MASTVLLSVESGGLDSVYHLPEEKDKQEDEQESEDEENEKQELGEDSGSEVSGDEDGDCLGHLDELPQEKPLNLGKKRVLKTKSRNKAPPIDPRAKGQEIMDTFNKVMKKGHLVSNMSYNAISRAWKRVDPISRKEPGPMRVEISEATNTILLWNVREPDSGKRVSLDGLRNTVQELISNVRTSFEAFTPASTLLKLKNEFKPEELSDSAGDRASLFDRLDNRAYCKRFAAAFLEDLRPQLDSQRAWKILEMTDRFADALVLQLFYVVGIPPRGWQIEELLLDSDHDLSRMFKKLNNGLFVLMDPKAKQNAKHEAIKQFNCAWGLPDEYVWYLTMFIGVVRPVQITLLNHLKKLDSGRKLALQTHIFVRVTSSKMSKELKQLKFTYDKDLVNKLLKESGLNLTARELRHIYTALSKVFFPEFDRSDVFGSNSTSVMNLQAQHNQTTGEANYARNSTLDATGYTEAAVHQMLAHSYNLQSLTGARVQFPKAFAVHNFQDFFGRNHLKGFIAAQQYVYSSEGYDLEGAPWREGIFEKCTQLQKKKPYLFGKEFNCTIDQWKMNWKVLGDGCLVTVAVALADGFELNRNHHDKTRLVASSVYLIEYAMERCHDKDPANRWGPISITSDVNRLSFELSITRLVEWFRNNHEIEWRQFGEKVDGQLQVSASSRQQTFPQFSQKPFCWIST